MSVGSSIVPSPAFEAGDERRGIGAPVDTFRIEVGADQAGQRLDRMLADAAEAARVPFSRTRVQQLVLDGHVSLNGAIVHSPSRKLALGTIVTLDIPEAAPAAPAAQHIPFTVVFEDEHLLVLEKPAGLVVHPSAGHADGTLVNALVAHCGASLSGINGVKRPGIVHRLDRDTSGLLVVAKTDAAHAGLAAIFADHGRSGSLVREYVAFVWGTPERPSGTIESALGRDQRNRLKVAVVPPGRGRHAVTHWQRRQSYGGEVSCVLCRLETGRTHQIRVHMASMGHPLVGDGVYGAGFRSKVDRLADAQGRAVEALGRQALHAATLGFAHPVTGSTLLFRSALPPDLAQLETALAGR